MFTLDRSTCFALVNCQHSSKQMSAFDVTGALENSFLLAFPSLCNTVDVNKTICKFKFPVEIVFQTEIKLQ